MLRTLRRVSMTDVAYVLLLLVFVALGMPFGLLGVLFAMDVVEHWVGRASPAQPDVSALVPQQRQTEGSNDPQVMVGRGPLRQAV